MNPLEKVKATLQACREWVMLDTQDMSREAIGIRTGGLVLLKEIDEAIEAVCAEMMP